MKWVILKSVLINKYCRYRPSKTDRRLSQSRNIYICIFRISLPWQTKWGQEKIFWQQELMVSKMVYIRESKCTQYKYYVILPFCANGTKCGLKLWSLFYICFPLLYQPLDHLYTTYVVLFDILAIFCPSAKFKWRHYSFIAIIYTYSSYSFMPNQSNANNNHWLIHQISTCQ